jgi:threonine aldolase
MLEKYLKDSGFPTQSLHKAHPRLVSLENSTNRGGGVCYKQSEIEEIARICKEYDLKLHLDGARIFNALTVTKQSPAELARPFDSISICLSKGLGAPLGSVLLTRGNSSLAFLARKLRKVMGGGMRQSGIVAAAGLYALKNNIPLLAKDHERAKALAQTLATLPYVKSIQAGESNILIFELNSNVSPEKYLKYLNENNLLAMGFGGQFIRFVTHLDFTDSMLKQSLEIIKGFSTAREFNS